MNKKSIIILAGSVIGILVVLLIIVWLMTVFSNHYYTYETVEDKIVSATEKYYKNNPQALPSVNGKYNLSYNTLVENEYIKPLNEILKDGDRCSAEIYVINNNSNYSYIPKLNCGENYQSRELFRQVLNDNQVVTSGSGLYRSSDGTYYFRGKINNNYVAFGSRKRGKEEEDYLWQIISLNPDNTVTMRSLKHTEERTPYDDRYNETREKYDGYNDFSTSIFKDFLLDLDRNNTFLPEELKSKLVAKKICIAKRQATDTSKDGSTECSEMSNEEFIYYTLLPYQYMRASLDENCKVAGSDSCSNFNFLSASNSVTREWSVTADKDDNYHGYTFDGYTFDNRSIVKTNTYIYPVVTVSEYAFYKSGTGTQTDPYRLFKKNTD